MFAGHNPYLVALSVVIAVMGGYTGFGLAARVATRDANRRLLLAGAACFLAIGIWTMHFVGMLAAPIPGEAAYLVLPTVVSFLICALVVGVSLFFVSIGKPSHLRVMASAVLLGAGIVSMHYVGIHGLEGPFRVEHHHTMVVLAALIAIGTAYGGLRVFLARQGGRRLALSAVAVGLAVSGMHYTAMPGRPVLPAPELAGGGGGLVALDNEEFRIRSGKPKMEQIVATGARTIVTACENCVTQLQTIRSGYGLDVEVKYLTELVSENRVV